MACVNGSLEISDVSRCHVSSNQAELMNGGDDNIKKSARRQEAGANEKVNNQV